MLLLHFIVATTADTTIGWGPTVAALSYHAHITVFTPHSSDGNFVEKLNLIQNIKFNPTKLVGGLYFSVR